MVSKIGFEMNVIVVEAIRGRCASFTVLTSTVSEIFGGQTTPYIVVVYRQTCLRLKNIDLCVHQSGIVYASISTQISLK